MQGIYARTPKKATVPLDAVVQMPSDRLKAKLDSFCREYGMTFDELRSLTRIGSGRTGPNNESRLELFRGIIQYLRETLGWSYPRIGDYLGRDHATIIYHHKPDRAARQKAAFKRKRAAEKLAANPEPIAQAAAE